MFIVELPVYFTFIIVGCVSIFGKQWAVPKILQRTFFSLITVDGWTAYDLGQRVDDLLAVSLSKFHFIKLCVIRNAMLLY